MQRILAGARRIAQEVERTQLHPTREFYQVTLCSWEMKQLNREMRQRKKSTTPSVLTNPSATSPRSSSCCGPHLKEKNETWRSSTGRLHLDAYCGAIARQPTFELSLSNQMFCCQFWLPASGVLACSE